MATDQLTGVAGDLEVRAAKIAAALKIAFGGRSQVSTTDIGRAVAGQINNNGLAWTPETPGTIEEVCLAVVTAFDEGHEDETPLEAVVEACREALSPQYVPEALTDLRKRLSRFGGVESLPGMGQAGRREYRLVAQAIWWRFRSRVDRDKGIRCTQWGLEWVEPPAADGYPTVRQCRWQDLLIS